MKYLLTSFLLLGMLLLGGVSRDSNYNNACPIQGTCTGGGGTPTPQLMQFVTSSTNPVGVGIAGRAFKFSMPNALQAGDVLVCGFTLPNGKTISVTDSLGMTWPSTAAVTADAGTGNYKSSIWVLPNVSAGYDTITVGVGASNIQPFQYTCAEFSNIATVSPVNGTLTTGATPVSPVAGVISAGSFTPGNNDANGGNAIFTYIAPSGGSSGLPTNWAAASGYSILDGDIAWHNGSFPKASQWLLQTTAASTTPSMTVTGDSVDTFNSVSVALKAASGGGTPMAGIHINKIFHFTNDFFTANQSWHLLVPVTGNLQVFEFPFTATGDTVSDNYGGTWTKVTCSCSIPFELWYSVNRTPHLDEQVTIAFSGTSSTTSVRFYDIANAAAAPFDVSASGAPTCTTTTTTSPAPSITASAANELVIAGMPVGQGPVTAVTAPAGAGALVFDVVTYTGELDTDLMENADGQGHYYNGSDTTAENWTWTLTHGQCQGSAGAAFHS